MSAVQITRPLFDRSVQIIDSSGILDILSPAPAAFQRGRRGKLRPNTRIYLVGVLLCTRIGQETTTTKIHQTLTQNLPRELQLELGVIRPLTTAKPRLPRNYDPEQPRLTNNGKPRKEIWVDEGYERIGYDDLANVVTAFRKRLDYGYGTQPALEDQARVARRTLVEDAVDCLITVTVISRTGSTVAIDGTGIWAWNRGPTKERAIAVKKLKDGSAKHDSEDDDPALEVAAIGVDEDGNTAPIETPDAPPAEAANRSDDADWGYKTGKEGRTEVGYGYHQHTIVRTPDPNQDKDSEPLLVEGIINVPANEDVVDASLRLIERAARRSAITRVIGDLLYTNLKAHRWAVPLAQRGIEQVLAMRTDSGKLLPVHGAVLQYGWLHCPSAPLDQRPLPAQFARDESEEYYEAVDAFRDNWAFSRKESGLGKNGSSKWICPAMAGRAVCLARDPDRFKANLLLKAPRPMVVPPEDWQTRKSCTNTGTLDFTPDPFNSDHQRKLMQREYYGDRRWRRATNLRSLVEGTFGILKNPSRLRIRRGHNRIPGLAMANLINGLKVALFNEEQLRAWYERNLNSTNAEMAARIAALASHPLLEPDAYDWGVTSLSKADAKAMDREYLFGREHRGSVVPIHPTRPKDDTEEDAEGEIAA